MTPPAMAPTFGPDFDGDELTVVDGAAEEATQTVC